MVGISPRRCDALCHMEIMELMELIRGLADYVISPTWTLKGLNVLGVHTGDCRKEEEIPVGSSKTDLLAILPSVTSDTKMLPTLPTHRECMLRVWQTPAHCTTRLSNKGHEPPG